MDIPVERFTSELFALFEETFEDVHGMYLDGGTSLFETLATISAEEASIPVSANCASIAAQVEHVRFYLEVVENYLLNKEPVKVDWQEIWRTVREVTPEQWEASKARLKASHDRILEELKSLNWDAEYAIAAPLEMLVHTAFHLGQIREATCTIKAR